MEAVITKVKEVIALYEMNVVGAVIILVIGYFGAKLLRALVVKLMKRSKVDETLTSFVSNVAYVAILAFVIIAAMSRLGIQTASFVAVLGAAGLAIGLALQGALANFAAGVLMIIFKPFKVGDYIEGGGVSGVVEHIEIFTTQLKSPDNKTLIVPNAKMTSDSIVNYSAKETRRVDMVFGIGYGDDMDKAKAIIEGILEADDRVLKDPAVTVAVSELGDSSVNFVVRPWVKTADYWDVLFDTQKAVKEQFDKQGVSIPFPQQDVHIYKES